MSYDENLHPECQIIPQIYTFFSEPFGFLYKTLVAFNDLSGIFCSRGTTSAYLEFYVC